MSRRHLFTTRWLPGDLISVRLEGEYVAAVALEDAGAPDPTVRVLCRGHRDSLEVDRPQVTPRCSYDLTVLGIGDRVQPRLFIEPASALPPFHGNWTITAFLPGGWVRVAHSDGSAAEDQPDRLVLMGRASVDQAVHELAQVQLSAKRRARQFRPSTADFGPLFGGPL